MTFAIPLKVGRGRANNNYWRRQDQFPAVTIPAMTIKHTSGFLLLSPTIKSINPMDVDLLAPQFVSRALKTWQRRGNIITAFD
jgi:hypothetical protein